MKTLKKEQCLIARFMELKEENGIFGINVEDPVMDIQREGYVSIRSVTPEDGPNYINYYGFLPEELKYSKSWDWLMPVVSKLCKSGIRARYPQTEDIISEVENISGTSSIKDVYTLVIAAITRYNNSIGFDA